MCSSRAALNLSLYGNPAGKLPIKTFKKKLSNTMERMIRENKVKVEDASKWVKSAGELKKKYKKSL